MGLRNILGSKTNKKLMDLMGEIKRDRMVKTVSPAPGMHKWMAGGANYDKEEHLQREDIRNSVLQF